MSKLVLCVGGGISAYKAPDLVRHLIREGHEIQVLLTEAARNFVSELSLTIVSGRELRCDLFNAASEGRVGHIEIADWADLVVVAPATADLMARAAYGLANDIVSTVLLATTAPIIWAPAMNSNMWSHPATQLNFQRLAERGGEFAGPVQGQLACGWIGEGKMMEPQAITDVVRRRLNAEKPQLQTWRGKRVLISTGPTRSYIDPVRFISNASTGKMGMELARAARDSGSEVVVVSGPTVLPAPDGVPCVDVQTGTEMLVAMQSQMKQKVFDLVAMVAAVSDIRLDEPANTKIEKNQLLTQMANSSWSREDDLLANLCQSLNGNRVTRFLGFAAQTVDELSPKKRKQFLLERGREKMASKSCHAIFVNPVDLHGHGFGSQTNGGYLLFGGVDEVVEAVEKPIDKYELALWILGHCSSQWFSA